MSEINNKTIKDYLIGKATAKEMEQLAEWLAVSEENQKEFFEMELAFHLGKNNQFATSKKIEEAETKLFDQIREIRINFISSAMLQQLLLPYY